MVVPKANIIQIGHMTTKHEQNELEEKQILETTQNTPNNIKFVDLCWFISEKDKFNQNELDLIIMSFNTSFGNIRINGYLNSKQYIVNNALFLPKNCFTINAAIYPAGMYKIRHLLNGQVYSPIEQLFVSYDPENNPWHNELVKTKFNKQNDKIQLTFIDKYNNPYIYIFSNEQVNMLNFVLDNILEKGIILVSQNKK